MRILRSNTAVYAALVIPSLLLWVEIIARLSGIASFPIYQTAPGVEYELVQKQSGTFLHKNHWSVNDSGFNNPQPFTPSNNDCLLVGDSVVYGGNPVDESGRVGQLAEQEIHSRVWVGAAGGWQLLNELGFLKLHQHQLMLLPHLVLILNNGDFGPAQVWTDELTLPTRRPLLVSVYAIRRYLLPHPPELPPIYHGQNQSAWQVQMDELLRSYSGRVSVILYPDQADLEDQAAWERDVRSFKAYSETRSNKLRVIDISRQWDKGLYRDGIHPNAAGNGRLAHLVGQACRV